MLAIKSPSATGRQGGRARSPAKTLSARQNVLLRWHSRDRDGVIPERALIDGAWYQGRGRSAPLALWDASHRVFQALGWSGIPDPENFPKGSKRVFRIKQERHAHHDGGTFYPMNIIPLPHHEEKRGN